MRKIYKYVIPPNNHVVAMPWDRQLLGVGAQGNNICIWAEVEPDAEPEKIRFAVVPTGGDVPKNKACHLGTVLLNSASLVFHIYLLRDDE